MTAPKRPALDRAVEAIERCRRNYRPIPAGPHYRPPSPELELRAVGHDLLRELADEWAIGAADDGSAS